VMTKELNALGIDLEMVKKPKVSLED